MSVDEKVIKIICSRADATFHSDEKDNIDVIDKDHYLEEILTVAKTYEEERVREAKDKELRISATAGTVLIPGISRYMESEMRNNLVLYRRFLNAYVDELERYSTEKREIRDKILDAIKDYSHVKNITKSTLGGGAIGGIAGLLFSHPVAGAITGGFLGFGKSLADYWAQRRAIVDSLQKLESNHKMIKNDLIRSYSKREDYAS